MLLFHGSNTKVPNPRLDKGRSPLDFGIGFYLTTSKVQASQWAVRKSKREEEGLPILNIYEINDNTLMSSNLKIKEFQAPTMEWLDFVIQNRNETYVGDMYDVIIGPVADDGIIRTIRLYMNGIYTKEEAIRRFKPENLEDQYLFTTKDALSYLNFKEAIVL